MMWLWLAPLVVAAVAGAYVLGHQRGSRPWREEQYQRAMERRLTGDESPEDVPASERAVIRAARIAGSKNWRS